MGNYIKNNCCCFEDEEQVKLEGEAKERYERLVYEFSQVGLACDEGKPILQDVKLR